MKKHIPLFILSLFIGGCAPPTPTIVGVAVPPPVLPEDGIKHTLISSSDTPYEGVITEGTKEKGRGIFVVTIDDTLRKDNWYEGEFLGTKFHGQGTYTWADGRKYVGEYKDGKFHGQGTYTYADGVSYVGEFKNG